VQTVAPDEAAARLEVHLSHLLRLLRGGEIATAANGEVDAQSLEAYIAAQRPPEGHISARQTAEILGISPRLVYPLVADGTLPGVLLPRAHGSAWALREAVEALDRVELAQTRGIRVRPPDGWLTSRETCEIIGCGRSTLRWLVAQGLIEKWTVSSVNTWYRAADVRAIELAPA